MKIRAEEVFPVGFWWPPPPEETTDERYKEIAECNFNFILGGNGYDQETNIKRLELCKKYGMGYYIADSKIYQQKVEDKLVEEVIETYKEFSALKGYLLMDEPGISMYANLRHEADIIREKDPSHIPLFNLLPTYADRNQLQFGVTRVKEDEGKVHTEKVPYEVYVDSYMKTVRPEVLSYDHYCTREDGTDRPDFYQNIKVIRNAALKYNIPFWGFAIVQPIKKSYRDTTEAETYWQIYSLLAYGAKGVLYFCYWKPGGISEEESFSPHGSIIDGWGKRTHHYEEVKKLNSEVLSMGSILLNLKSENVSHTGEIPMDCRRFKPTDILKSIKGGKLVVGEFSDSENNKYIMLVNKNYNETCNSDLMLKSQQEVLCFNCQTKTWEKLDTVKNKPLNYKISIEPGRGKLLKFANIKQDK